MVLGRLLRLIIGCYLLLGLLILTVQGLSQGLANHVLTVSLTDDIDNTPSTMTLIDTRTHVSYAFADDHIHYNFVWTHDGTRLIYQRWRDNGWTLDVANVVDGTHRRLLDDVIVASRLPMVLSPDDTTLALGIMRDPRIASSIRLHTITLADNQLQDLSTEGVFEMPNRVQWLPDNQRLIVRGDFPRVNTLFSIIDSAQPEQPIYLDSGLNAYEQLIPLSDGSGFLIESGWEIAYLPIDNLASQPETLISGADSYTRIALAPDSRRFAFVEIRGRTSLTWVLRLYDRETASSSTLLREQGIITDITWSPDGEWLAYYYDPLGKPPNYREVYIIRPDGTGHQQIASGYTWQSTLAWRP